MSELLVDNNSVGKRLDSFLGTELPEHSRSYWQKAIKAVYVEVNGGAVAPDYNLQTGDKVEIKVPEQEVEAQELPIIYEDGDVIVFDKPAGLLTHSKGAFNPEFTVASYMREHFYPEDVSDRAGIVHRLDRGTSGVIICAKTELARQFLQRQFSSRAVVKTYHAVVEGQPKQAEVLLDWPIGRHPKQPQTFRVHANGKPAQTHLKVTKVGESSSLVELKPTTGRTHQLRVHLKQLGHPIVGDSFYGGRSHDRLLLHASRLELTLPSGQRQIFKSPLPATFKEYLRHAR